MSQSDIVFQVPYPEDEVYEWRYRSPLDVVKNETQTLYDFEKVVYPGVGGILLYCKGLAFPIKGFPTPETLEAANMAKRILMGYIRTFAQNKLALISLLKTKSLERWLRNYNYTAALVLRPYYLKPRYYIPACREIGRFITVFLRELGVDKEVSSHFGKIVATCIQADTAYRYRIEDLATVTDQAKLLEDPRGEILKVLDAMAVRDANGGVVKRFRAVASILLTALYLPWIRRAFKLAMLDIRFEDIQMDEADRYHTLRYDNYQFGGRPLEERLAEYKTYHPDSEPPKLVVNE